MPDPGPDRATVFVPEEEMAANRLWGCKDVVRDFEETYRKARAGHKKIWCEKCGCKTFHSFIREVCEIPPWEECKGNWCEICKLRGHIEELEEDNKLEKEEFCSKRLLHYLYSEQSILLTHT
jgi:hypothetical protein